MSLSVRYFSTRPSPVRRSLGPLDKGTILISQSLVEELNDVLGRGKFNRYVTREERESFFESLIRESELVGTNEAVQACRDPKEASHDFDSTRNDP